tara:strand:- start:256 stop:501 length:246 start_codon:yes stop_codon:yes gene_type:complete
MKNFINSTINDKLKNNETPSMDFITSSNDMGHVQLNGNNWGIFFNGKCVNVSKTLTSTVKKLKQLGVTNFDLELEQFKNFF